VREVNGIIMGYYHADGQEPDWEPPTLPEYESGDWSPFTIGLRGNVRTHPQELMENGIDTAHLGFLHRRRVRTLRTVSLEFERYRVVHHGIQTFTHPVLDWLGLSLPPHKLTLTMHGLSILVAQLHVPWLGIDLVTLITFRPIDGEFTEVAALAVIREWRSATISRFVKDLVVKQVAYAFSQDVWILERKMYREAPVLGKGDGSIMRFRRWSRQFYGVS
jgi:hypothetical protein